MKLFCWWVAVLLVFVHDVQAAADLRGVVVAVDGDAGAASFEAELIDTFKLQIRVQAQAGAEKMRVRVRVQLPNSGPNAWPAADVEVRDGGGKALQVQRTGIEWFKLSFAVPQGEGTYTVQAVAPAGGLGEGAE